MEKERAVNSTMQKSFCYFIYLGIFYDIEKNITFKRCFIKRLTSYTKYSIFLIILKIRYPLTIT